MQVTNVKKNHFVLNNYLEKTINKDDTEKRSRIANLKPNEIGYLHVSNFKQDGIAVATNEIETILEVNLAQPILPGKSTVLTLDFEGQ